MLNDLDFVASELSVSYRAATTAQVLHIDVTTAGRATETNARGALGTLIKTINAGAAGGEVFPPSWGCARQIGTPDDDEVGPNYHFELEVTAVAPRFIRSVVEELRLVGFDQPVTRMSLRGDLPADGSPLSVTEREVRSWVHDSTAYLRMWPQPGFRVAGGRAGGSRSWATLRVELNDGITLSIRNHLEELALTWLNVIRCFVADDRWGDDAGREVIPDPMLALPKLGNNRTEFRARYREFLFVAEPSRAALVNLLARFHETHAPILQAEIWL